MALVGNRRKHHLTLELPLPPPTAATRLHFTPVIPTMPTTTTSASSVSDYEKLFVLGHGNGGTVYKVRHRQNPSTTFALKLLHPSNQSDPAILRQVTREITVYSRASDSPHVLRCHSVLADHHSPAFLLEYMDAGTLESLLRRHNTIPSTALPSISRQVLLGLSHLHSHQIVHRDIKPSNLLVNSHGEIKISDFGVSRVMARSLEHCHSFVGTCAYMSPERFDPDTYGHNYDGYAADVWSLGLTVMELFLGYFALLPEGQRPDWATLMCAICFGDPPALPLTAPEELRNFVDCCLQKEPSKRWTVAELLKHPFVTTAVEVSKEALLGLLVAPEEIERGPVTEL